MKRIILLLSIAFISQSIVLQALTSVKRPGRAIAQSSGKPIGVVIGSLIATSATIANMAQHLSADYYLKKARQILSNYFEHQALVNHGVTQSAKQEIQALVNMVWQAGNDQSKIPPIAQLPHHVWDAYLKQLNHNEAHTKWCAAIISNYSWIAGIGLCIASASALYAFYKWYNAPERVALRKSKIAVQAPTVALASAQGMLTEVE